MSKGDKPLTTRDLSSKLQIVRITANGSWFLLVKVSLNFNSLILKSRWRPGKFQSLHAKAISYFGIDQIIASSPRILCLSNAKSIKCSGINQIIRSSPKNIRCHKLCLK